MIERYVVCVVTLQAILQGNQSQLSANSCTSKTQAHYCFLLLLTKYVHLQPTSICFLHIQYYKGCYNAISQGAIISTGLERYLVDVTLIILNSESCRGWVVGVLLLSVSSSTSSTAFKKSHQQSFQFFYYS